MASFIYIYSRFTEELLLLGAAGMFALLSAYCYYWVIRKRRLGAARNEIPATVVKAYLGQLINEAQFVRTQLFGIAQANLPVGDGFHTPATGPMTGLDVAAPSGISGDLNDRLRALQYQLSEKESLVVNINIEKTKLLEELENLRQNQHAVQNASSSANSEDMIKKIKTLEERLEEYSLFEDDLANLKRLQQENTNLKKRIEEMTGAAPEPKIAAAPVATPAPPASPEPSIAPAPQAALDQNAIDALLDGTPAVPPTTDPVAEPSIASAKSGPDEFERLVDSVESSLDPAPAAAISAEPSAPPATPAPAAEHEPLAAAEPSPSNPETLATKSDEELLKEFENLLNS
jgi:hypothetical protein